MKLVAAGEWLPIFPVSIAFLLLSPSALSAQTAQCSSPPGGSVTCEKNQVATCAVKDGKVDGRCKTPPTGQEGKQLEAAVLSDFLGRKVSAGDLDKPEYKEILRKGKVESQGRTLTFSIPQDLLEPRQSGGSEPFLAPSPKTSTSEVKNFVCQACTDLELLGSSDCKGGSGKTEEQAKAEAIQNLCGLNMGCVQKASVKCTSSLRTEPITLPPLMFCVECCETVDKSRSLTLPPRK